MRPLNKPAWLLFSEKCKAERLPTLKFGKDPRRAEDTIYGWWLEAEREHQYEGTANDWFWLIMGPRYRRNNQ
jgi:hypothetical protein